MSRKEPSFAQLVAYMQDIDKSDTQYNIYHNIYGRKLEDIEAEFMNNARHIHKRKNGVYLYHEILSITKNHELDDKKQKEILRDIAYEYARERASNNLIFATLHDDHDEHLHYHFCISANALGVSKKTRMSKKKFDAFKKGMEARALEKYPELAQKVVINQEAGEKLSNKGAEAKRRTGKTPQRDAVKAKLADIFATTDSKQTFFEAMSEAGFEVYVRGQSVGVVDTAHNRKHRLKTLGLLEAFHIMSARIKLEEASNAQQEKAEAHHKDQDKPAPDSVEKETPQNKAQVSVEPANAENRPGQNEPEAKRQDQASESEDAFEEASEKTAQALEAERRKAEIEKIRQQKQQTESKHKQNQNKS